MYRDEIWSRITKLGDRSRRPSFQARKYSHFLTVGPGTAFADLRESTASLRRTHALEEIYGVEDVPAAVYG